MTRSRLTFIGISSVIAIVVAQWFTSCGESDVVEGPTSKKAKPQEKSETKNRDDDKLPTPTVTPKLSFGVVTHEAAYKKCSLEHFLVFDSLHKSPSAEIVEMYRRTICGTDTRLLTNKIVELKSTPNRGDGTYLKQIYPESFQDDKAPEYVFVQVTDWKKAHSCDAGDYLNTDLFNSSQLYGPSEDANNFMKDCLLAETKATACRIQDLGDKVKLSIYWQAGSETTNPKKQIDVKVSSDANVIVPELYQALKVVDREAVDVLVDRQNPKATGKVTVSSGDQILCSVDVPRALKGANIANPACGVATWRENRTDVCGVELYAQKEAGECGVALWRESRSDACGVELYNERQDPACGVSFDGPGGGGGFGGIGGHFGGITVKRCRRPEFGVERYNSCRHPNHGPERYNSCRHPNFGVELWKACRHPNHGPESYNACFIYDNQ